MRSGWMALGIALALALGAGVAGAKTDEQKRADDRALLADARATFDELAAAGSPDREIPRELLEGAKGIAVFPRVINAAIGIGGRRGRGLITVRGADGAWSPPAFATLTGGSWGFQFGAQATELVLFLMSDRSVHSLLDSKFALGAKAGLAAGPVGRSAEAGTDVKLNAAIYSYAKSKGLFAGISLEGARVAPDRDANERLYGAPVTADSILFHGSVQRPEAIEQFLEVLPRRSGTAEAGRE